MKKAFQLCDSCNLQPSCPTGVALDCFESGKEVEIRTCESYMPRSKNVSDIIPADEGEVVHRVEDNTVERWHEEGEQ